MGRKPHGAIVSSKKTAQQCSAKSKRTGERCKGWAMPGRTTCYQHGGSGRSGRPPVHGRYSKYLVNAPSVQEAYEYFKADPAFNETLNEIALLRANLAGWLESQGGVNHPKALEVIASFVDGITRAVERRHKMQHGELATITQRDYQARLAYTLDSIARVYGRDARYDKLLEELGGYNLDRGLGAS